MKKIDILNGGYVILQDYMGSDLSVTNSARVSYNKKKDVLDDKDKGLIDFLAREGHTSPFRHTSLQFEVYVPLYVARQHWKHIIGSGFQDPFVAWNESSRRYITEEPEFYIPNANEWRSKPANSKQGSGENLSELSGGVFTKKLEEHIAEGERLYEEAMEAGVAPEQARLFLPAYSMFVRYYWTGSLQGVAHFLNLRLPEDAQYEIRVLAEAVQELAHEKFPLSLDALLKYN
ncbi:TPA: FAD-dependent thymidylate synthase [Salmonella enterica subsp. enterica serovar Enteritidis]|jgi:thymidylate synthase (FAD)|uniref:FAD-dependent thymidylate synthase n=1 Tax=Paenibacillus oralis TaxID=2490856 RepID=A0A3P3TAQ3_9BACL|nr:MULTISPECIES: FAD-dependent thymidylate synthase [Bacillales]OIB02140.1 thymidylate synthase, flavin-dependent [Paenibacillus sp. LC231]RRJ54599.1 FAD-dependent thymidylate synthase [Paenibacillus oralis]